MGLLRNIFFVLFVFSYPPIFGEEKLADCPATLRTLQSYLTRSRELPWAPITKNISGKKITLLPVGRSQDESSVYFTIKGEDLLLGLPLSKISLGSSPTSQIPFVDMATQTGFTCFGACTQFVFSQLQAYGHDIPAPTSTDLERHFQNLGQYVFHAHRLPYQYRSYRYVSAQEVRLLQNEIREHLKKGGIILLSQMVAANSKSSLAMPILLKQKRGWKRVQRTFEIFKPWDRTYPGQASQYDFIRMSEDESHALIRDKNSNTSQWVLKSELYKHPIMVGHARIISGILDDDRIVLTDPNFGWPIPYRLEDLVSGFDEWYLLPRTPFVPRFPHQLSPTKEMVVDTKVLATGGSVQINIIRQNGDQFQGDGIVLSSWDSQLEVWLPETQKIVMIDQPFNFHRYQKIEIMAVEQKFKVKRAFEVNRFNKMDSVSPGTTLLIRSGGAIDGNRAINYNFGTFERVKSGKLIIRAKAGGRIEIDVENLLTVDQILGAEERLDALDLIDDKQVTVR